MSKHVHVVLTHDPEGRIGLFLNGVQKPLPPDNEAWTWEHWLELQDDDE